MTIPIKTVKKEIRILGLDFCRNDRITGAVVRGGQFLDGMLTIPNHPRLSDREIGLQILKTRYYPELRAVMTHDALRRSEPKTIEKTTRLPVIRVAARKPSRRGYKIVQAKRGRLWVQTELPSETIERIISLTWTFGKLPEPARIAHLLARTRIPAKPRQNDKE